MKWSHEADLKAAQLKPTTDKPMTWYSKRLVLAVSLLSMCLLWGCNKANGDMTGWETPENVAEPPAEAEVTSTGLASVVLQEGTGSEHPGPTTEVTVHYAGWTTDGEMFDSSVARGEPASFPLNRVIAGWTEGLQLMVVGERRRFWIPEDLAYGGQADRPQGMLVFDVELISF